MRKVINHEELLETFTDTNIVSVYEECLAEVIDETMKLIYVLEENYGTEGNGGFIFISEEVQETEKIQEDFNEILINYNLDENMYEYDDLIAESKCNEYRIRVYILTEFHIVYVYGKEKAKE